jgi:hypothetical protein
MQGSLPRPGCTLSCSDLADRNPSEKFTTVLRLFQHLAHFVCALSELFLKFTDQFVIFAFNVGEVVVGQLGGIIGCIRFPLKSLSRAVGGQEVAQREKEVRRRRPPQ